MKRCVPLEPAAEAVSDDAALLPRIYQLPPDQGREALERAQDAPVAMWPADISRREVTCGGWGTIPVYFVRPENGPPRRTVFYIHGAGWVFGSFHTHEKLVREIAARTGSLVVFPEYSRAPEARYPVALEQCWWLLNHLRQLDALRGALVVAGDSVGGNMALVMALLAKERSGPAISRLLLYYPVTNACFNTPTYRRFADGYYLYRAGMVWFWRQYAPNEADRRKITASPLRAGIEQLRGLPETMIVNGQADVLRSEGEAMGEKLRRAGVPVTALRVQGTIHDFVMLNALDQTRATRAAMDASTAWLGR